MGVITSVQWLLVLPLWHIDAVVSGGVHPIAIGRDLPSGRGRYRRLHSALRKDAASCESGAWGRRGWSVA